MSTFGVALIEKDEGRYLPEWIAYHFVRGASLIRVYDNESSASTIEVLSRLSTRFPLEVINWPLLNNDFNYTQKMAYSDAVASLAGKVDFVALIDTDEFLCGDMGNNIGNTLSIFDARVGAIACQQIIFGSSGHERDDGDLVISRFCRSANADHQGCLWFKTIVRPETFLSMETVHSVETIGDYVLADQSIVERTLNPRFASKACLRPIRLNHYMLKSEEEFVKKQNRMMATALPPSIISSYNLKLRGFQERDRNLNASVDFEISRYAVLVQGELEFMEGLR